jgi:outer membrane lipase/esterase
MTRPVLRRALVAAACAAITLLASCGGGTIESALKPTRMVAFGDAITDLGTGAASGGRYTVNDGIGNVWAERVANSYGVTLASATNGGQGYARGNARVIAKPDAAGSNTTLSVKEQVDAYLGANGGLFAATDVVLIGAGYGDVIAEMAAFTAGTSSREQLLSNVKQAGRELGLQVRRLTAAGAKYVVVSGTYNLGKSPWAVAIGQTGLLTDASFAFNDQFLISVVDLGANVLYADAALHYNLVIGSPAAYSFTDSTTVVCNSVDAGPGIGIGRGQVNSALCTPTTIVAGLDYNRYLFADRVYPTPRGQQLFGDYTVSRMKSRW